MGRNGQPPGAAGTIDVLAGPDVLERFWSKVDKAGPLPEKRPDLGPCWVWTGSRNQSGYGNFAVHQADVWKAHRFSYLLAHGELRGDLEVDHLCRNRGCVNPRHLEEVTHLENTLQSGNPTALNAAKTHCLRGHEFNQENTAILVRKDGSLRRWCRACGRIRWHAKKSGEGQARPELSQLGASSVSLVGYPAAREDGRPVNLRVECSWCRVVLEEGDPGAATSGGICPPCDLKFQAEADAILRGIEVDR